MLKQLIFMKRRLSDVNFIRNQDFSCKVLMSSKLFFYWINFLCANCLKNSTTLHVLSIAECSLKSHYREVDKIIPDEWRLFVKIREDARVTLFKVKKGKLSAIETFHLEIYYIYYIPVDQNKNSELTIWYGCWTYCCSDNFCCKNVTTIANKTCVSMTEIWKLECLIGISVLYKSFL